jgi:uncharacterized alkaline shock family protein YloU
MKENARPPGKTTIAPDVLETIAQLTTLSVNGVATLAPAPSSVNRLFKKESMNGVIINVDHNYVNVDVYVILKKDFNIRDVSRTIQAQVARSISEIVGMDVGKINIHVEDIDYE